MFGFFKLSHVYLEKSTFLIVNEIKKFILKYFGLQNLTNGNAVNIFKAFAFFIVNVSRFLFHEYFTVMYCQKFLANCLQHFCWLHIRLFAMLKGT
jgi:hypothetical protein